MCLCMGKSFVPTPPFQMQEGKHVGVWINKRSEMHVSNACGQGNHAGGTQQ